MASLGILIAVGGTGAKVAEALVHASAAGLGPRELIVGFVDQDGGNGNTGRARETVERYARARAAWRAGAHRLDDESELLAPSITLLDPANPIWVPHPDGNTTLNRATGHRDQPDDALFDLLFEAGAAEQDLPLGEGYRGRPNIGAAAIALAARDPDQPFLRALDTVMRRATQGAQVRLVIAGSLFGGTGAAGFPTLAQLLRQRAPADAGRGAFAMAGALMLPYFGFPPPNDLSSNVAFADAFLLQSRTALRYYHDLLRDGRLPFDQLYLTGWNPLFQLRRHAAGSGEQRNDAMIPELVAALGACRFMRAADPPPAAPEILVSSRAEQDALAWTDLPAPGPDPLEPYRALARQHRFAVAWQYWSRHAKAQGAKRKRLFLLDPQRDPFYKKQQLDRIDWVAAPPQAETDALDDWTAATLEWARQLADWPNELPRFNLWSPARHDPEAAEAAYAQAYDAAILPPEAVAAAPSAADLNTVLANDPGPDKATGLGKLVSRLHAAAAVGSA